MKPIPIFWGRVEKGVLRLRDKRRYDEYLQTLEGEIELTLKRWRKGRSLAQNAYWHGVVLPIIAGHIGELDEDELCQIFAKKFLSYYKTYKGKEYKFTPSTAQLDTAEMAEFIRKVVIFVAQEFGIVIPDPDKVVF